jgi:hypothetical protein
MKKSHLTMMMENNNSEQINMEIENNRKDERRKRKPGCLFLFVLDRIFGIIL